MIGTSWNARPPRVGLSLSGILLLLLHAHQPVTEDKKRVETGRGHESDDSDRPKKKAPAKSKGKTNGKTNGKANGKANGVANGCVIYDEPRCIHLSDARPHSHKTE